MDVLNADRFVCPGCGAVLVFFGWEGHGVWRQPTRERLAAALADLSDDTRRKALDALVTGGLAKGDD